MVADGGDDGGDVLRVGAHVVEDAESHHCAGLGMIHSVDHVADVVNIAGDLSQLRFPRAVAQGQQDLPGGFADPGHMGEGMLRIPQGAHGFVGLLNVSPDLTAVFDIFNGNH